MTDVGEADSSLATQCLALCQSLTSQGMVFNFSLAIGSTLLLLCGHQEQGGPAKQGQEEGQPVNPEEKHEAQRGVLEEEVHIL